MLTCAGKLIVHTSDLKLDIFSIVKKKSIKNGSTVGRNQFFLLFQRFYSIATSIGPIAETQAVSDAQPMAIINVDLCEKPYRPATRHSPLINDVYFSHENLPRNS